MRSILSFEGRPGAVFIAEFVQKCKFYEQILSQIATDVFRR